MSQYIPTSLKKKLLVTKLRSFSIFAYVVDTAKSRVSFIKIMLLWQTKFKKKNCFKLNFEIKSRVMYKFNLINWNSIK